MNINFLVPCNDYSGGLKVVAAYGNALLRAGHTVNVIYPERKIGLKQKLRNRLKMIQQRQDRPHLAKFHGNLLAVDAVTAATVPPADCTVATAWQTAEWAQNLNPTHGSLAYLVQGYETWTGPTERVDATFQLPFRKIAISEWIKQVVEAKGNEAAVPVIRNGKDFFLSEAGGEGQHRKYDVGYIYSPVPVKGAADGLEVLRRLKTARPYLRIVMFGTEKPQARLPEGTVFLERPRQAKIRQVYLDTKIWLNTSLQEGFALPVLEAMSLGSAVVATDSLGVREMLTDGETGRMLPPGDTDGLYAAVTELLDDEKMRRRFAVAGLQISDEFSWAGSAVKLEQLLLEMTNQKAG
jgi:glycosyltransferase involved in cell wall biosynthesis